MYTYITSGSAEGGMQLSGKTSDAQIRATIRYNEKNVKQVKLNLNRKTDADVIDFLNKTGNIQGTIKSLIRREIEAQRAMQE